MSGGMQSLSEKAQAVKPTMSVPKNSQLMSQKTMQDGTTLLNDRQSMLLRLPSMIAEGTV